MVLVQSTGLTNTAWRLSPRHVVVLLWSAGTGIQDHGLHTVCFVPPLIPCVQPTGLGYCTMASFQDDAAVLWPLWAGCAERTGLDTLKGETGVSGVDLRYAGASRQG